jgi:hypothetical protein
MILIGSEPAFLPGDSYFIVASDDGFGVFEFESPYVDVDYSPTEPQSLASYHRLRPAVWSHFVFPEGKDTRLLLDHGVLIYRSSSINKTPEEQTEFDVFSLLTHDAWYPTFPQASVLFQASEGYRRFVEPRIISRLNEAVSKSETPEESKTRYRELLAELVPLEQAAVHGPVVVAHSQAGLPVMRAPMQGASVLTTSGRIRIDDFLRERGVNIPPAPMSEEAEFPKIEDVSFELPDAAQKIRLEKGFISHLNFIAGREKSVVQDYLTELLDYHKIHGIDNSREGADNNTECASVLLGNLEMTFDEIKQSAAAGIGPDEIVTRMRNCLLDLYSNIFFHSKRWPIPFAQVAVSAIRSQAGGSVSRDRITLCLFRLPEASVNRPETANCILNFYDFLEPISSAFEEEIFQAISSTRVRDRFPHFIADLADSKTIAVAFRESSDITLFSTETLKPAGIVRGASALAGAIAFRKSSDGRRLLQLNGDGRFYLYEIGNGRQLISGMSVDGEIVMYDDRGYYDASPEGAHYVYWYFPGLREYFTFDQFQSRLHRPDIIRSILQAGQSAAPRVALGSPPEIDFEIIGEATTSTFPIRINARSGQALKSVRLFMDGAPIDEIAVSGKVSVFERNVLVPQGTHWITAVAYDQTGYGSVPMSARVSGAISSLPKGRLFFVGIAVDNYPNMPNLTLNFAKRDIELVADTLKKRASAQYSSVDVKLLLDAEVTPDKVVAALRDVGTIAGPLDTLIVSFAGHGMADNKTYYFLTSDITAQDLTSRSLEWSVVAQELAKVRSKVIVLLDACHSGATAHNSIGPNDGYAAAMMRTGKAGMAVLAASKGRELSHERADLDGGHGLFSYAVARALDQDRSIADWRSDGVVDLDSLYRYVKTYVSEATKDSLPQTPWLSRNELIGQVPIL